MQRRDHRRERDDAEIMQEGANQERGEERVLYRTGGGREGVEERAWNML